MKPPIQAFDVEAHIDKAERDPDDPSLGPHQKLGPFTSRNIGAYLELTKLGADIDTLGPGSRSSVRHWHSKKDELVLVLDGELVLITDMGETIMRSGMVAGFKAGEANAHHLINRSEKPASFLVIGSKDSDDSVTYPHDDLQWCQDEEGNWFAAHKDGTPY